MHLEVSKIFHLPSWTWRSLELKSEAQGSCEIVGWIFDQPGSWKSPKSIFSSWIYEPSANICGILCHTSDHPLSLSAQSMQPFENTAPVEHWKWSFLETDSDPTSWIVCHPSYSPVKIDRFGLEFHCFQGKYLGVVWWRFWNFAVLALSAATVSCYQNIKMSDRNRSWLWPKWSNWHHDGSPFYKVSKLAPDLKAFYHNPEGHLMPQWRPEWDMAKKNLKLGWAMGLRSLQDAGLPWGDKLLEITILFCWKCCSSDFTATSRSSSRCSCSKWIARSTCLVSWQRRQRQASRWGWSCLTMDG